MKLPHVEGTTLRVITAFLWLPAVITVIWFSPSVTSEANTR